MERYFNLFKVKYDKLIELISENCSGINRGDSINVFISVESITKILASKHLNALFSSSSKERIKECISCFVNVAAHYRRFFYKHGISSNIYFYVNHPFDGNFEKTNGSGYREWYEFMFCKNIINHNLIKILNSTIDYLKITLQYMEGIYVLTSNDFESSVIPRIIEKINPKNINFIVTRDLYDLQYVNHKNFYIIYPTKGSDDRMLNKNNAIEFLKKKEKCKSKINIKSEYLPVILSILGNTKRNICKLPNIGLTGILNRIKTSLDTNVLYDGNYDINILKDIFSTHHDYDVEILNNYIETDINTQFRKLSTSQIYNIESQLIDKVDNEGLRHMNDTYFDRFPMYLIELFSGVPTPRKNIFRM